MHSGDCNYTFEPQCVLASFIKLFEYHSIDLCENLRWVYLKVVSDVNENAFESVWDIWSGEVVKLIVNHIQKLRQWLNHFIVIAEFSTQNYNESMRFKAEFSCIFWLIFSLYDLFKELYCFYRVIFAHRFSFVKVIFYFYIAHISILNTLVVPLTVILILYFK